MVLHVVVLPLHQSMADCLLQLWFPRLNADPSSFETPRLGKSRCYLPRRRRCHGRLSVPHRPLWANQSEDLQRLPAVAARRVGHGRCRAGASRESLNCRGAPDGKPGGRDRRRPAYINRPRALAGLS